MQSISEPKQKIKLPTNAKASLSQRPVFDLLFRSYFILAMLSSIGALLLWLAFLMGYFTFSQSGLTPLVWHIHEMLFAFAATVAVGFVLTAVQTWTGAPSIRGKRVFSLVVLWFVVRLLLWRNSEITVQVAIVAQALWWLSIISVFSKLVLVNNNRRNYLFIPLFSVMAIINITILMADLAKNTALAVHLARSMVLLFTLLMAIVGGRVIPFFTVNGAKTQAITNHPLIERLLLPAAVSSIAVFVLGYFIKLPFTPAVLMMFVSGLHFIRLARWRSIKTLTVPLLWSLHLAYFFMALGLFFLGLSYFFIEILFSSALHLITVGAIGLMILSMMSRVSLGHTGRALQPSKSIRFAFYLMLFAAIVRPLLPLFNFPILAWQLSTVLWCLAGVLFIGIYWPILSAEKISR